jgi:hypothetical protein
MRHLWPPPLDMATPYLGWSMSPQRWVDRELRDQDSMAERGRRLTAYRARCEAVVLDGDTCEPLGEGFVSARVVGVKT